MQATCHPDQKAKAFGLCFDCYRRTPEQRAKATERTRQWRAANPDRVAAHTATSRAKHLAASYGITLEDYDSMLAEQGGTCAICDDPPGRQNLAVDHDHQTGAVRGLLCDRCNPALAQVEREGWVGRAVAYLARSK